MWSTATHTQLKWHVSKIFVSCAIIFLKYNYIIIINFFIAQYTVANHINVTILIVSTLMYFNLTNVLSVDVV